MYQFQNLYTFQEKLNKRTRPRRPFPSTCLVVTFLRSDKSDNNMESRNVSPTNFQFETNSLFSLLCPNCLYYFLDCKHCNLGMSCTMEPKPLWSSIWRFQIPSVSPDIFINFFLPESQPDPTWPNFWPWGDNLTEPEMGLL